MPRIRTTAAAGLLAGATILGGAGLAGATDAQTPVQDPAMDDLQAQVLEQTSGDDMTTGEPDAPATPTLPSSAATQARDALAAAPAFSDEQQAADDEDPDEAQTTDTESADTESTIESTEGDAESTEGDTEVPAAAAHGQEVSETARSTEPGPDHGTAVSEVARQGERPDGEADTQG